MGKTLPRTKKQASEEQALENASKTMLKTTGTDQRYKRPIEPERRKLINDFISRLVLMKEEACRLGLYKTHSVLNWIGEHPFLTVVLLFIIGAFVHDCIVAAKWRTP